MKRSFFSFVLLAVLLSFALGPVLQAHAAERVSFANKDVKNADGIKVLVNGGIALEFDTPILISEGRTLVPMRKIAEAFHYNVEYKDDTKSILMNRDSSFIRMQIGDNSVFVSNSYDFGEGYFIMERQPEVYGGRTYVPLRAVAELFQCNVHWDAKTKTISINRVMGHGGDSELQSGETELPAYYYYGQTLDGYPNANGFLRYGYEMSSYFRGEFRNALPNGTGLMKYSTGEGDYYIMGSFKDGMMTDGSVLSGIQFSFVKDGKVTGSYKVHDGGFIKIPSAPELNEDWFKAVKSEVNVFKR